MSLMETVAEPRTEVRSRRSQLESSLSFFFALLTCGVGFVVRPLGAIVFGSLGDLVGRKKTHARTTTA
jgi:MFS family permease